MKILAIDDEIKHLEKVEMSIKEVIPGIDLISYSSPEQAIKYIDNNIDIDVAFIDTELGTIKGIQLAKKLLEKNPKTNIIFMATYLEYILEAIQMRASGYILKPATPEKIQNEMENLRFQLPKPDSKKLLQVKCFGKFEVYANGIPVMFKREKAKELFAYLIDKNGTICSPREISAVLWEEDKFDYLRKLLQELRETFIDVGAKGVLICGFKKYRIEPNLIECDYFDYLDDKPNAVKEFRGSYMEQYSWAEDTLASLLRK